MLESMKAVNTIVAFFKNIWKWLEAMWFLTRTRKTVEQTIPDKLDDVQSQINEIKKKKTTLDCFMCGNGPLLFERTENIPQSHTTYNPTTGEAISSLPMGYKSVMIYTCRTCGQSASDEAIKRHKNLGKA